MEENVIMIIDDNGQVDYELDTEEQTEVIQDDPAETESETVELYELSEDVLSDSSVTLETIHHDFLLLNGLILFLICSGMIKSGFRRFNAFNKGGNA